jgi:hypothetical protein
LVSNFEYEFAQQGIPCFLADASIEGPSLAHSNFHFRKAWISSQPIDEQEYLSLSEWIGQSGYETSKNLALQMDIEGSEWNVFLSAPRSTLEQFAYIITEFHSSQISLSVESVNNVSETWKKLLESHVPVWIHPNNGDLAIPMTAKRRIPPLLEVCLVRRDLAMLHNQDGEDKPLEHQPVNDKRFKPLRGLDWVSS